jgi:hypothetical protein
MDNGARLKVEKIDNLTKYYLAGSWRRQDATSAQIADSGIVVVRGDITTYVMDAGLARQLTGTDTVSWSIRGMSVDFTSLTASPFVDLATTGAWTRRLNATTDLVTSLQFEWLARDDLARTETLFARAMVGLNAQLSKQLTFKGSVGVGLHKTDQNGVPPPSGPEPSDAGAGWLADAQLVYRPAQTTEVSLAAVQSMAPSAIGEINTRTAIIAGLRQGINRSSYVLLLGEFNHQTSLDGLDYDGADYFRASVMYGYRLAPEWQAQLSYRFAERHDGKGVAHANTFFVSVVREVIILP